MSGLILLQAAVVLGASNSVAALTRRLGQPLVVAEILAGILLGPSCLGLLWPAAATALFPEGSLDGLRVLSHVGLVLFMFSVGLELDPALLAPRKRSFVFVSHASIAVPFALGAGVGWWLWPRYSPGGVSLLSFVTFLGVAMSVTAFPVLARILDERRLLGTQIGSIAIGCAAIDDVTAWCLLAVVVGIARAGGLTDGLWTVGLAVCFGLVMGCGVRPMLRQLLRGKGDEPAPMAVTLIVLLASSFVSEAIGVHALFGAFVCGLVMPKQGEFARLVKRRLESVAVGLLLPLFFAYSGLRTQLGLLDTVGDWLVAAALVGAATLGKFGGGAMGARLSGLSWREAGVIGVLMNTRGLMELVVLNVGMDLGVISPNIFTMLVIMAVATTVATTPVLSWLDPRQELLRPGAPTNGAAKADIGLAELALPLSVCVPESELWGPSNAQAVRHDPP